MNNVDNSGVDVKQRVLQHGKKMSVREIATKEGVPPSTVWHWIKEFEDILDEIAKRYGGQSFSNHQIRRDYASQSPDVVEWWLNELAATGRIVNGYSVKLTYNRGTSLYPGVKDQQFLLLRSDSVDSDVLSE